MRWPSRFSKMLGAAALFSAALLVGVTATSAWAVDDKADGGQDRAAAAQGDAGGRQSENPHRADNAQLGGDNSNRPNDNVEQAGDARAAESNPDGSKDPGGNNGTIKVDLLPFDDTGRNDTDTHSECQVEIEFFGFDANELVEVTFFGVNPTNSDGPLPGVTEIPGDGDHVREVLDGDGVTGTGDATAEKLDDQQRYNLSAALATLTPDPRNGYHIRVEADAVGAPGGAKTKVFWLECNPAAPVTTSGTTTTGANATTTGGNATTTGGNATTTGDSATTPGGSDATTDAGAANTANGAAPAASAVLAGIGANENAVANADVAAVTAPAAGLPEQASDDVAGAAVAKAKAAGQAGKPDRLQVMGVQHERGNQLARTGIPIALMVLAGLGLVGAGSGLRRAGRRPQEGDLEV